MARRQHLVFAQNRRPHRIRRFFIRLFLALLIVLLIAATASFIVSHRVRMETLRVTVADLPDDLNGFTILHLSDLHGGRLGRGQSSVGNALGKETCSCVVFTGDMLGPDGDTGALLELLALDVPALAPDVPKLYLPGDEDPPYLDATVHGSASALADWAEALRERGVTILDRPVLFTRGRNGGSRLWIVPENVLTLGLDSYAREWTDRMAAMQSSGSLPESVRVAAYHIERAEAIRQSVADMRENDILVVVSHRPVTEEYARYLNSASSRGDVFVLRRAALVLSGHLCGGQWRLPGLGPVYVPDYGWFPGTEGISGMGWIGGVPQYISPGLGASRTAYPVLPVRVFNPPTATRLVLTNRLSR